MTQERNVGLTVSRRGILLGGGAAGAGALVGVRPRSVAAQDAADNLGLAPVAQFKLGDFDVHTIQEPDAAIATRKRVFDMIATDKLPFIGYHLPFPALGYVTKVGDGYQYVAASYQLAME
jgi:hypothetical protein